MKVSQGGGSNPVWTKNGGELCFRQGMSILAVDVTLTPSLSVSEPTLLFRGRMTGEFDAAADGSGFVTLMPVEEQVKEQQVIVVFDWFEDLRQRMKGAK